jgi:hypothetical protein
MPALVLYERGGHVRPIVGRPNEYVFHEHGIVLCVMTFEAIRSLDSRMGIAAEGGEPVEFALGRFNRWPEARRAGAERAVREAFMSRLAYKSLQIQRDEVEGFDSALMDDRVLMQHYTPVAYENTPMYAARVIAGMFDGGSYLAVVEEEWAVLEDGIIKSHKKTHQIAAVERHGEWVVVSDEIID